MPIHVGGNVRQMDDETFQHRAYEVMRHVFDVQNELGRLFHEKIYQRELAYRVPDARREVPMEVLSEDHCKTYYADLLIAGGLILELKAVEALADQDRRQLMQHLFLTELPHGKLVNLRTEHVQHEFVNNTLTLEDRTGFAVADEEWEGFCQQHGLSRVGA